MWEPTTLVNVPLPLKRAAFKCEEGLLRRAHFCLVAKVEFKSHVGKITYWPIWEKNQARSGKPAHIYQPVSTLESS